MNIGCCEIYAIMMLRFQMPCRTARLVITLGVYLALARLLLDLLDFAENVADVYSGEHSDN